MVHLSRIITYITVFLINILGKEIFILYYRCNTKNAVFIGIPNITKNYDINLIYSIDRGEFNGYKSLERVKVR